MMTNPIGRLNANNAAYNWLSAANSLTNLCSFTSSCTTPANLLAAENNLTSQMFNASLMYKIGMLQDASMKKLADENIKRSFSTFA